MVDVQMHSTKVIANVAAIRQACESAARPCALSWLRCIENTVAMAVDVAPWTVLDIPAVVLEPAHQHSYYKNSKFQGSRMQSQAWTEHAGPLLLEWAIV